MSEPTASGPAAAPPSVAPTSRPATRAAPATARELAAGGRLKSIG